LAKRTPCNCPKDLCLHPNGAVKDKSLICRRIEEDVDGLVDDESIEAAGFNPWGADHPDCVEDALIAVLDQRRKAAAG
jgi:hypothetical protein